MEQPSRLLFSSQIGNRDGRPTSQNRLGGIHGFHRHFLSVPSKTRAPAVFFSIRSGLSASQTEKIFQNNR